MSPPPSSAREIRAPAIPDYEMLRLIGRGSFGDVWIARNVTGALRAIKVVWRDRFTEDDPYEREFRGLQRFAQVSLECARQLALLHVGRDRACGFFYSVMELADDAASGRQIVPESYVPLTLRELCQQRGALPAADAIRIGVDLTGALVELHQAGLIHRDIKPANVILVGGVPKLADIGLVAVEGDARTEIIGTKGYVPPEGPGTPRADIYATGKVLYELATGLDRSEYPILPQALDQRPDTRLFFELNQVIGRACKADPAQRYVTSRELLNDLAFLQAGKSMLRLRTLECWGRRAIHLAVATAVVVVTIFWWFHRLEREEWARQLERKEWARQEQRERLADSFRQRGIAKADSGEPLLALPSFLRAAKIHTEEKMSAEDDWGMAMVALWQSPRLDLLKAYASHVNDVRFSPDSRLLAVALEGGEVDLWELPAGRSRGLFGPIRSLASQGVPKQAAQQLLFFPDGKRLLCRGDAGGVFVWEVDRPEATLRRLQFPYPVFTTALSPDGRRLATSTSGGTNVIWELTDPLHQVAELPRGDARCMAFSPDGASLAIGGSDLTARIVRPGPESLPPVVVRHRHWVYDVAFSPDGRNLATGAADQDVCVWNVADGELVLSLPNDAMVSTVRYPADGKRLVTVARDHAVRVWNTRDFRSRNLVVPQSEIAIVADASADGQWLATGSEAGALRVWNVEATAEPMEPESWTAAYLGGRWLAVPASNAVMTIPPVIVAGTGVKPVAWGDLRAYSGDAMDRGFLAVYAEGKSDVVLWVSPNGAAIQGLLPSPCLRVLGLSEVRGWLAYEAPGQEIILWNQASQSAILRRKGVCYGIKSDPKGEWLTLEAETHVELINAVTGESRGEVLPRNDTDRYLMTASAFSPDGQYLAVAVSTGSMAKCGAMVFKLDASLDPSKPLPVKLTHDDGIRDLTFSGDSRLLITVGEDRLARAWRTTDWQQQGVVMRHAGEVRSVAASPDGTRLLTASQSRLGQTDVLCFWDLNTGQQLSSRAAVGGNIAEIGYLPERKAWVFECVVSDRLLDPSQRNHIGHIFWQPLTDMQLRDLHDAAHATMGFEIDEAGNLRPIPFEQQEESFKRLRTRRQASPPPTGQSPR